MTETTASISWAPVQAVIDRYMVRYTSADGDAREVPVGKAQSSTELTGLRPGVEYTVLVWAEKGDRESKKADTKALTGTVRDPDRGLFTGVGCGEERREDFCVRVVVRGAPFTLWRPEVDMTFQIHVKECGGSGVK